MTEKITVRQSAQSMISAARYLAAEMFWKLCQACGLAPKAPPPRECSPPETHDDVPPFRVSQQDGRKLAEILDGCSSVTPMDSRATPVDRLPLVSSTYCGETSFCGHSPCPDEHCRQDGGHLLRKEEKRGGIHEITS